MDVFYSYTYGSTAWLFLQACPLIASPTIILTLLSPEVREPTVLEEYFSRSLGISLCTLGILIVLLTGSVPLTSSISERMSTPVAPPQNLTNKSIATNAGVTTEAHDPKAPYAVPVLTISTIYHSTVSFYCYTRYISTNQIPFCLGSIGSGGLATLGLWCLLFAASSGRISRKTGSDKRTSGFPFGNKESASAKKKELGKGL